VDFDVHHGNGTQEAFYEDPRVLYFSVHEYPFYPGSGRIEETGRGDGVGTTVNVPLPAYCGDLQYREVADQVLVPAGRRFAPQFVLVSAGYDAHWADPLAFMQVTLDGFAALVQAVQLLAEECCDGRLALCLEGGYHLDALPRCVQATFDLMLGRDLDVDDLPRPQAEERATPNIRPILEMVRRIHRLS
ncbi:MAG: histone deacetylase, partial [Chloroflexi bacterium]|nr:histone deacetylase [Chloroflexota bacterium]